MYGKKELFSPLDESVWGDEVSFRNKFEVLIMGKCNINIIFKDDADRFYCNRCVPYPRSLLEFVEYETSNTKKKGHSINANEWSLHP